MTDVLTNAGVAVLNQWHALKDCPGDMYLEEAKTLAGAALLAALDPEDEALVEVIRKARDEAAWRGTDHATAIIRAISKHAQGETRG